VLPIYQVERNADANDLAASDARWVGGKGGGEGHAQVTEQFKRDAADKMGAVFDAARRSR